MITVTVSPEELAGVDRWFQELDKESARANRRALLFAGKKARSLAVKEIAALVRVQQKSIRRKLKVFAPARANLGALDFVRVWLGLRGAIKPKHDRTAARAFAKSFAATMPSGHVGQFIRRPNRIKASPRATHANPSRAGRANPGRHALPIDEVQIRLDRDRMLPILIRHARDVSVNLYPNEFRRLLERIAARRAR